MKFGKEFRAQMVPEWQGAYMDYEFLKTLLKDIQRFQHSPAFTSSSCLKRKLTLYRAFSGLTQRNRNNTPVSPKSSDPDFEKQPILVSSVNRDGIQMYETTFFMISEVGGEYEQVFFRRLDYEFNKVDKFYRSKVEEVMKEAAMLNTQMDALIAFRVKVDNPLGWSDRAKDMTHLASDVAASTAALSASIPSAARASSGTAPEMDVIDVNDILSIRPAPMEILDHVKINNTSGTPLSKIQNFLRPPEETELKFTRENLKKVEEQLKRAFVEFYRKLRLLKSYSFLNTLAFSKIMKKYDKVTTRNASKTYMKMVDNSYLGSSDEVTKLMERVEATFIKHFSNSNRSKGMRILRPNARKERHTTTFYMGFLFGCTVALIVALVLIIHIRGIMNEPGRIVYMETMFPLYSLFGLIVLHLLIYAANIYFWRRCRVNYSFIFGFKQGTELDHRQVLLCSFGIAVLALCSVLLNLDMEMDPKTQDYKALTELLPLNVLILLLMILLLPFNFFYRSARFFLLTCLFHCIVAPLYKVTLPDFFLADQFTSQVGNGLCAAQFFGAAHTSADVEALRSLEFYICYYGWGDYELRQNTCSGSTVFKTFSFIVAGIPYWCRVLQCLRRLFEDKDPMHGCNGVKYLLTIVALCFRTAYSLNRGIGWRAIAWALSAIAAIFGTYWDVVFDWGLLRRRSKNRWLRDKLLVPYKSVYFGAMVLNVLLRFAWLQTVLNFSFPTLNRQTMIAIVASLEIIRRGIWNFFRLENEHLNNVGKYRAFKSVPLPFNYDEDDDKDVDD